jgi:hypothetical protein
VGFGVLGVQFVLALLAFIPAPHNGGDNATYISLAHSLLESGTYRDVFDPGGLPHTKYPPVFPALLALWIALGARTWVALKTVPMVFTTVAVALTYLWASGRRGPWLGGAVALLFAASTALLDASHWILSEPPFLAFTLLSLWAFDRVGPWGPRDAEPESPGSAAPRREGVLLAVGGAAATLAYFTRSAGLPLVVAALAWLAWRRRWRSGAALALGLGSLALLWWLRARGVTGLSPYSAEFWLLNPYDPSLGRVGPLGLLARFAGNALAYTTRWGPLGLVGSERGWVAPLGVAVVLLAAIGWALRVRATPGVAELFLPLYLGLILLWPEVWSGERFALPLYPLLLFYAAEAVLKGSSRAARPVARGVALLALLALAAPAGVAWARSLEVAAACRETVELAGPWACYGPGVEEFMAVAVWSGAALPEGSSVLTRKPSIFYLMSGVPSRTFPFSDDPEVLLAEARAAGSRYLLLDVWDQQAYLFPLRAVLARPGAFCGISGLSGGSRLLGIQPVELEQEAGGPDTPVALADCPPSMLRGGDLPRRLDYSTTVVPLLARPGDP